MAILKRITTYLALLPFTFVLFAAAWLIIGPTALYYCWDEAWPFAIQWHPPFIHPWGDSLDGKLRDYYRAPEWIVYTVWFGFVAGVFVIPAILAWRRSPRGVTNVG